ncbi:hypothetical protein DXT77_19885 [Pseudomonas sp. 91RF]|uniref:hypothetical protein n=1 Tax=Pseudomonas sp. 91RF TaxID=2292261 RepID=UPI000E6700EA|nr:hypothetical protein [Pseudomonas sp. 91RF]RIJ08592.1 hypothetical protein DXT77_19885 [Pseudomonas sp. 91RF]
MMKSQLAPLFKEVFSELRILNRLITELENAAGHPSLRGHQTVDDDECIDLSFESLHLALGDIEQRVSLIAEAIGESRKL